MIKKVSMEDPFNFLNISHLYGTHRNLLFRALEATTGPVIEFGMGHESTPYLHVYCEAKERTLHSIETDFEWFKKFKHLESYHHFLTFVINFDDPLAQQIITGFDRWGVVFIDHNPGERRKTEVKRLADKTDIMVIHDTHDNGSSHNWPQICPLFRYRIDDRTKYLKSEFPIPGTTAVSNFLDVAELLKF